jgi:hypothetical protein
MHSQKGFHQGHSDFAGLKRHDCAIAADDLVMGQAGRGGLACPVCRELVEQAGGGGRNVEVCLHGFLLIYVDFGAATGTENRLNYKFEK